MAQNELSRNIPFAHRLLRLPEVEEITGVKKSSVYAMIKSCAFPAPVRLSARAVAWRGNEIEQWVSSRIKAGGKTAPTVMEEFATRGHRA